MVDVLKQKSWRGSSKLVVLLSMTLAVLFGSVLTADASHYRYGSLSWSPGTGNTVNFSMQNAWRLSSGWSCIDPSTGSGTPCTGTGGEPGLGDIFDADNDLDFGDSDSESIALLVTAVDPTNDWVYGIAVDQSSFPAIDTTFDHTYAGPGDFNVVDNNCCRISDLSAPNNHVNNPDGSWNTESTVTAGGANSSPVTAMPPIVLCQQDALCQFTIPATDPNGDDLTYRLSTAAEGDGGGGFVQPGPPDAPVAASIDPTTGLYSWDTTGADFVNGYNNLYSTQVMVEDRNASDEVKTKAPVDFLIQLVSFVPGDAPEFVSPTPTCGSTKTVSQGSTLNFTVTAEDTDLGDSVTLNAIGLPGGADMDPALPSAGNPISSNFSWSPTASDEGSTVVIFTATDTTLRQATCAITLEVSEEEPGVIQETDENIVYSPSCWFDLANAAFRGGNAKVSRKTNCTATLTFTGSKIEYYAAKARKAGKVDVLVDGTYQQTLDLYASSPEFQKRMYSRTFTSSGEHTITIKITGKKNALATDFFGVIDFFKFEE